MVRALLLAACALMTLSGCEPSTSLGKKIDYKSVSTSPALEVPPVGAGSPAPAP